MVTNFPHNPIIGNRKEIPNILEKGKICRRGGGGRLRSIQGLHFYMSVLKREREREWGLNLSKNTFTQISGT